MTIESVGRGWLSTCVLGERSTGCWAVDSDVILSRLRLMQMLSPEGTSDYWPIFHDLNSTIVSMESKNAELQRVAGSGRIATLTASRTSHST